MAKYKLTVKYNNVCDLSIAGDIPDIIANEFDQYVKSMLYKREEWENFEANFKLAAKKEYGNLKKARKEAEKESTETSKTSENKNDKTIIDDAPVSKEEETLSENKKASEKKYDNKDGSLKTGEKALQEKPEKPETKVEEKNKTTDTLSFEEYIQNKNIKTALDEFVAGACYLDEILDIKEFSLKQLNSKLYPAFGRLASSTVINEAIERVLIETVKDGARERYIINQNAWNYHNYDLVRHQ